MMKLILILVLVPLLGANPKIKYPILSDDMGLTTPEMIQNHGYPVEIHHMTTEDGYILEYHRVPHGFNDTNRNTKRPAIILMHGFTFCSVQDFAQGPKRSFGYMLADAGYDVWAANMRGNHYSHSHVRLHRRKNLKEFYDFSFHEVGHYDVPAAIDYILNVTGQDSLFYFGNSLGGTVFLTFASTRPEYMNKIKLAILASPAGYLRFNPSVNSFVSRYIGGLYQFVKSQNFWAVDGAYLRKSWPLLLKMAPFAEQIATDLVADVLDNREDAEALRPYLGAYATNIPSEAPIKHSIHYGQLISTGTFRQFDYGKKKNLRKYGTLTPPDYNISSITCPVALYYAKADFIVPYDQQLRLKRQLPNLVYDFVEPTGRYNHLSFGAAKDCADRVWKNALRVLSKYR